MASISKSMVHLSAYNHGNLADGALNLDSVYAGTPTPLRHGSPTYVTFQCQGDNTWRNFIIGNDFKGTLQIYGGDAASVDFGLWTAQLTSPAYGVSTFSNIHYNDGGWNTGTFSMQLASSGNSHVIQFKYSSYYSSSNNGGFYLKLVSQ